MKIPFDTTQRACDRDVCRIRSWSPILEHLEKVVAKDPNGTIRRNGIPVAPVLSMPVDDDEKNWEDTGLRLHPHPEWGCYHTWKSRTRRHLLRRLLVPPEEHFSGHCKSTAFLFLEVQIC